MVSVPYSRMSEWGMNTYLYAPKDDEKHRASWRDLYTLEEADQLSHLLHQASSRGIIFIYAIAPGLDMTFSSTQEMDLLKRKLDQVLIYSRTLSIIPGGFIKVGRYFALTVFVLTRFRCTRDSFISPFLPQGILISPLTLCLPSLLREMCQCLNLEMLQLKSI